MKVRALVYWMYCICQLSPVSVNRARGNWMRVSTPVSFFFFFCQHKYLLHKKHPFVVCEQRGIMSMPLLIQVWKLNWVKLVFNEKKTKLNGMSAGCLATQKRHKREQRQHNLNWYSLNLTSRASSCIIWLLFRIILSKMHPAWCFYRLWQIESIVSITIVVNHIPIHLVLCLIWTTGTLAAGNLTAYWIQGGRIIIMWASQAFFSRCQYKNKGNTSHTFWIIV